MLRRGALSGIGATKRLAGGSYGRSRDTRAAGDASGDRLGSALAATGPAWISVGSSGSGTMRSTGSGAASTRRSGVASCAAASSMPRSRRRARPWRRAAPRQREQAERRRPAVPGRRPRSRRDPAVSSARRAASVARNSSASGPSRMLARFRAICSLLCDNLARELAVRLRGGTGRVVLQHRAALHGRLGVPDRLPDAGAVHQIAEVLLAGSRSPRGEWSVRPSNIVGTIPSTDTAGLRFSRTIASVFSSCTSPRKARYSHCTGTITPVAATNALIVRRPSDGGVSTRM